MKKFFDQGLAGISSKAGSAFRGFTQTTGETVVDVSGLEPQEAISKLSAQNANLVRKTQRMEKLVAENELLQKQCGALETRVKQTETAVATAASAARSNEQALQGVVSELREANSKLEDDLHQARALTRPQANKAAEVQQLQREVADLRFRLIMAGTDASQAEESAVQQWEALKASLEQQLTDAHAAAQAARTQLADEQQQVHHLRQQLSALQDGQPGAAAAREGAAGPADDAPPDPGACGQADSAAAGPAAVPGPSTTQPCADGEAAAVPSEPGPAGGSVAAEQPAASTPRFAAASAGRGPVAGGDVSAGIRSDVADAGGAAHAALDGDTSGFVAVRSEELSERPAACSWSTDTEGELPAHAGSPAAAQPGSFGEPRQESKAHGSSALATVRCASQERVSDRPELPAAAGTTTADAESKSGPAREAPAGGSAPGDPAAGRPATGSHPSPPASTPLDFSLNVVALELVLDEVGSALKEQILLLQTQLESAASGQHGGTAAELGDLAQQTSALAVCADSLRVQVHDALQPLKQSVVAFAAIGPLHNGALPGRDARAPDGSLSNGRHGTADSALQAGRCAADSPPGGADTCVSGDGAGRGAGSSDGELQQLRSERDSLKGEVERLQALKSPASEMHDLEESGSAGAAVEVLQRDLEAAFARIDKLEGELVSARGCGGRVGGVEDSSELDSDEYLERQERSAELEGRSMRLAAQQSEASGEPLGGSTDRPVLAAAVRRATADLQTALRNVQAQLQVTNAEYSEFKRDGVATVAGLRAELAQVQQQLAGLDRDRQTEVVKHNMQVAELEAALNTHSAATQKTVQKIEEKAEKLRGQVEMLQQVNKQKCSEYEQLQAQHNASKQELTKAQKELAETTAELNMSRARQSSAMSRLAETQEVAASAAEAESLVDTLTLCKDATTLFQKVERVVAAVLEKEELETTLEELKAKGVASQALKGEHERLATELQECKSEKERLQEELMQAISDNAATQDEMESLRTELARTQQTAKQSRLRQDADAARHAAQLSGLHPDAPDDWPPPVASLVDACVQQAKAEMHAVLASSALAGEAEAEVARLRQQVEERAVQLAAAQARNAQLEGELRAQETTLKGELQEHRQELQDLHERLSQQASQEPTPRAGLPDTPDRAGNGMDPRVLSGSMASSPMHRHSHEIALPWHTSSPMPLPVSGGGCGALPPGESPTRTRTPVGKDAAEDVSAGIGGSGSTTASPRTVQHWKAQCEVLQRQLLQNKQQVSELVAALAEEQQTHSLRDVADTVLKAEIVDLQAQRGRSSIDVEYLKNALLGFLERKELVASAQVLTVLAQLLCLTEHEVARVRKGTGGKGTAPQRPAGFSLFSSGQAGHGGA